MWPSEEKNNQERKRKMYRINGSIEGIADFLFNKPTEKELERIRTGTTGGKFTDEQRIADAELKVHRSGKYLMCPSEMFINCMLERCKKANLKEGRRAAWPFLQATVFVDGDSLFNRENRDYMHTHWGRTPPKTGPVMIIRRPAISAPWLLPFKLLVMDDRRDADYIRTSIQEGGLLNGLGSWRPKYGRFILKEWNVVKDEIKKSKAA